MGADIHLYVEVKKNGKWVTADQWEDEDDGSGGKYKSVDYQKSFYHDRNYSLFAILADVRNGSGFAGIRTGDGFSVIDKPRGVPDDACEEYKNVCERWEGDGHSHSYFTVAELMAYDWTQTTKLQGWTTATEYWSWARWKRKEGESPDSYAGDVSGGGIKKVAPAAMELIVIQADKITKEQNYQAAQEWLENEHAGTYGLAIWQQPYYKTARRFLSDTLPRLWALGKPDEVRIVFFFDN